MADSEEEKMLKAIGRLERAELETLDPRLERLTHGLLSDGEHGRLLEDADTDPRLATDVLLHAPLSSTAQERLYTTAVAGRRAPMTRVVWLGPTLALAAVLAVSVVISMPSTVPEYAGGIRGGDAMMRSDAAPASGSKSFRSDSIVRMEIVPVQAIEGELVARLYVRRQEASADAWREVDVVPEKATSGAYRWKIAAERLTSGPTGTFEVVAVVGRPGWLPRPSTLELGNTRGWGWTSIGERIVVWASGEH